MAQYDIDEFTNDSNQTVKIDSVPLNETVAIPEFDCSRKEVEVNIWFLLNLHGLYYLVHLRVTFIFHAQTSLSVTDKTR